MIGDGAFSDQINRAAKLLKQLGMLEAQEYSPDRNVGASSFRGLTYRETWAKSIQLFAYDFKLVDQSLIYFKKTGNNEHDGVLGFSYLECPIEVNSYEVFCSEYLEIGPDDDDYEDQLAECGDLLRHDYEQYVNTCETKPVTPIRYDYAPADYMPGRHPASHVHFGFKTDIRVATKRILKPLSFVLFVIRQQYPSDWAKLLEVDAERYYCRSVRKTLDQVHGDYWNEADLQELILK